MREPSGNKSKVPLSSRRPRWGVLISGRGSNLASLLGQPEIEVAVVYSSNPKAEGLLRAHRMGVPTRIVPALEEGGKRRLNYEALTEELQSFGVTHVLLAGYMKIVPATFTNAWKGRLINLHPSLLPLYPGLNSIRNAFEDRSDLGITVHEVNEEVDAGRIIAQQICVKSGSVPQYDFETAEFLVHAGEQRLLRTVVSRWGRTASPGGAV